MNRSGALERAWIVYPDGREFGPFESVDLAIRVRVYVERVERREDLAIKRERELPWRPEDLTTEEDVERDTIRGGRHA